ncbi:VOC family protein [soil metagenome]
MVSKFTELCIDCARPRELAYFWSSVLDYSIVSDEEDEVEIKGADDSGPSLLFAPVPEGKSVKNRLHIDVNPVDRSQAEEVERVLALGARKVDIGQGDVDWVVLADPEDNEFCILRTQVS